MRTVNLENHEEKNFFFDIMSRKNTCTSVRLTNMYNILPVEEPILEEVLLPPPRMVKRKSNHKSDRKSSHKSNHKFNHKFNLKNTFVTEENFPIVFLVYAIFMISYIFLHFFSCELDRELDREMNRETNPQVNDTSSIASPCCSRKCLLGLYGVLASIALFALIYYAVYVF